MEILKEFTLNFINLANAMSIYILVGLLIAGVLKELLPQNFISKHLGKGSISSVIKATLLGIPMPVCSCSVIPLAKSLQKEGASRGAVTSFLISTPITGVDSILATYSFFGLFFTLYRVVTSIITAVIAGLIQNLFQKKINISNQKLSLSPLKRKNFNPKITFNQNQSCSNSCCSSTTKKESFNLKNIFNYAFNTLFRDIAKSLFIGLIIGAIFATFLPKELISNSQNSLLITYLLVLIISMPLYVCATSSLPIGASLLISGVPLGAVFVFLSAGPATNAITMSVVKEMFGKFGFFVYLGVIAILSLIFGYILDTIFSDIEVLNFSNQNSNFGLLNYLATTLMLALMLYYQKR